MDADETHLEPPILPIDSMSTEELIEHIENRESEIEQLRREIAMLRRELAKMRDLFGLVKT